MTFGRMRTEEIEKWSLPKAPKSSITSWVWECIHKTFLNTFLQKFSKQKGANFVNRFIVLLEKIVKIL